MRIGARWLTKVFAKWAESVPGWTDGIERDGCHFDIQYTSTADEDPGPAGYFLIKKV